MRIAAALSLLLLASPALADDLDAAKAGQIQAEIDQKQEAIKKQYGDKKLSPEERKEMNQKLQAATNEVLQKNGTSDKDFSRASTKMNKADHAAMEASRKDANEKAAKKASEPKKEEAKATEALPVIEKGPAAVKGK